MITLLCACGREYKTQWQGDTIATLCPWCAREYLKSGWPYAWAGAR